MFKDLFSTQSGDYAKYRPTYPTELFGYLASLVDTHDTCWDCGTGNGQAALQLVDHFDVVIATDPAEKQLANSVQHPKIQYHVASAESSGIADHSVDLITAAQAFHWFNRDAFFDEVRRVLKLNGVLAFWCYELAQITPEIDAIVFQFYKGTLGPYWQPERQLVEEGYRNIEIPFQHITPPPFEMNAVWGLDQLIGYLGTWSALQDYIKENDVNPLEEVYPELKEVWGEEKVRNVRWELGLRVARNI